jgi:hypothetical protein
MILLTINNGCRREIQSNEDKMEKVILHIKVISAKPFISKQHDRSKRWIINMQVVKVISSSSDDVKSGDNIAILVHSVIQTFLVNAENIVNKEYEIEYLDPYDRLYQGDLIIRGIGLKKNIENNSGSFRFITDGEKGEEKGEEKGGK